MLATVYSFPVSALQLAFHMIWSSCHSDCALLNCPTHCRLQLYFTKFHYRSYLPVLAEVCDSQCSSLGCVDCYSSLSCSCRSFSFFFLFPLCNPPQNKMDRCLLPATLGHIILFLCSSPSWWRHAGPWYCHSSRCVCLTDTAWGWERLRTDVCRRKQLFGSPKAPCCKMARRGYM